MALNFPSNTAKPYVDPISGLKYIFNTTVGAWESAIQPPVIVYGVPAGDPQEPNVSVPGFLWWNNETGDLKIYYVDQTVNPPVGNWKLITTGPAGFIGGDYNGPNIFSGLNPPDFPGNNDLWYDTNVNQQRLKIYRNNDWNEVFNPDFGVVGINSEGPVKVDTSNPGRPIISVDDSTSTSVGLLRISTQEEVDTGISVDSALSPGTLKLGIDTYLPDATEDAKGIVKLATQYQVNTGRDDTSAITPRRLKSALPVLGVMGNPTGTVISFAGMNAPEGYLVCDGSEVNRIEYDVLYSAIGTIYGSGDGSTTFNLPDLRGEFIRGWSSAGGTQKDGVDTSRKFGSSQDQSIESHAHTIVSGPASTRTDKPGGGSRVDNTTTSTTNNYPANLDSETRPMNVAMLYCIKS